MIKVNLAAAKARLSHYLASVERGETVILCRRNVPVAEIRPLPRPLTQPRPIGTDPDLVVPDSFFDPLPEDLLGAFEGRASRWAETGDTEGREPLRAIETAMGRQAEGVLRPEAPLTRSTKTPLTVTDVIARLQAPQSRRSGSASGECREVPAGGAGEGREVSRRLLDCTLHRAGWGKGQSARSGC